ncbi:MAG: hypothetical protein KKE77_06775 [Alphaproteobacteria bacterium]|nr:hypothetical protein [Alphaproteobacteria bacterium]
MKSFEFTIAATGLPLDTDEWEYAFYEAGCDDATVSLQRGVFILFFDREAEDFESAARSACDDIQSAGAKVLRIEPDPLVSSSDIAERAGITRQAASLYTTGGRGDNFPLPVAGITSLRPLWSWEEVVRWLADRGKLAPEAIEQAECIQRLNFELQGSPVAVPIQTGKMKGRETAATGGPARPFTRYEDYARDKAGRPQRPTTKPKFRETSRPHGPFVLRPEMTMH